jgi:gamma-glutamylcyclotransferase (GGCT)/AIG2-like uncharacterized protein YtfP
MHRVFAYGTLMQGDVQQDVLGKICKTVQGKLSGCKVCEGQWPYLVPLDGSVVGGYILMDLSDDDLQVLDVYERVAPEPLPENEVYERKQVDVRLTDGTEKVCWVYFPILDKWRPEWLET